MKNHDFQERSDVFNYIHYMHDILTEETKNAEEEIDISKINNQDIIDKMMKYQTKSIEHMRPVTSILTMAEQEISTIFTYLDNYRNVSKEYFVKIVNQVDKM